MCDLRAIMAMATLRTSLEGIPVRKGKTIDEIQLAPAFLTVAISAPSVKSLVTSLWHMLLLHPLKFQLFSVKGILWLVRSSPQRVRSLGILTFSLQSLPCFLQKTVTQVPLRMLCVTQWAALYLYTSQHHKLWISPLLLRAIMVARWWLTKLPLIRVCKIALDVRLWLPLVRCLEYQSPPVVRGLHCWRTNLERSLGFFFPHGGVYITMQYLFHRRQAFALT